jgi:hypothetical protein
MRGQRLVRDALGAAPASLGEGQVHADRVDAQAGREVGAQLLPSGPRRPAQPPLATSPPSRGPGDFMLQVNTFSVPSLGASRSALPPKQLLHALLRRHDLLDRLDTIDDVFPRWHTFQYVTGWRDVEVRQARERRDSWGVTWIGHGRGLPSVARSLFNITVMRTGT